MLEDLPVQKALKKQIKEIDLELNSKLNELIVILYQDDSLNLTQQGVADFLNKKDYRDPKGNLFTQPFISSVLIKNGVRTKVKHSKNRKPSETTVLDIFDAFFAEPKPEVIKFDCNLYTVENIKSTKEVIFNNVSLLGVELVNNKIYVVVRRICKDLGIDESAQYKRIKNDELLKDGMVLIATPDSKGVIQNSLCLDIDYLPIFLIGIQSSRCKEEVRPYLKDFKLKAKDKLAEAFISKVETVAPIPQSNNYLDLFDIALKSLRDHENKILSLENKFNIIETKLDIQESNREKLLSEFSTCEYSDRLPLEVPVRKKITSIVNAYVLNKFPNSDDKNYSSVWSVLDREIYKRLGFDIHTRLENLKSKGIKKTRLDVMEDLNILDAVYDIVSFIFKVERK